MKTTQTRLIALGSLLAVLGTTTASGIFTPSAFAQPPVAPGAGRKHKERHPELRKAMRALQNAKTALQNAAHDFGGHRVKALEATEQAIKEVQEAMKSDQN